MVLFLLNIHWKIKLKQLKFIWPQFLMPSPTLDSQIHSYGLCMSPTVSTSHMAAGLSSVIWFSNLPLCHWRSCDIIWCTVSNLTDSLVLDIDSLLFEACFWAVIVVSTANTFTAGGTHDVGLHTDNSITHISKEIQLAKYLVWPYTDKSVWKWLQWIKLFYICSN